MQVAVQHWIHDRSSGNIGEGCADTAKVGWVGASNTVECEDRNLESHPLCNWEPIQSVAYVVPGRCGRICRARIPVVPLHSGKLEVGESWTVSRHRTWHYSSSLDWRWMLSRELAWLLQSVNAGRFWAALAGRSSFWWCFWRVHPSSVGRPGSIQGCGQSERAQHPGHVQQEAGCWAWRAADESLTRWTRFCLHLASVDSAVIIEPGTELSDPVKGCMLWGELISRSPQGAVVLFKQLRSRLRAQFIWVAWQRRCQRTVECRSVDLLPGSSRTRNLAHGNRNGWEFADNESVVRKCFGVNIAG